MNLFFEKLEIRALKERIKSLPQIGGSESKEILISVTKLDSKKLDTILKDRKDPIAISFDVLDGILSLQH